MMRNAYRLSKDYELLYTLLDAGFDIPCWVDLRWQGEVISQVMIEVNHLLERELNNQAQFVATCERINLGYIKPTLHIGEWIIADIIGEGIYEIIGFDDYHVSVKVKKNFLKGWVNAGHVTVCCKSPQKIDIIRWLSYKRVK